jgi:hypothetical protein
MGRRSSVTPSLPLQINHLQAGTWSAWAGSMLVGVCTGNMLGVTVLRRSRGAQEIFWLGTRRGNL